MRGERGPEWRAPEDKPELVPKEKYPTPEDRELVQLWDEVYDSEVQTFNEGFRQGLHMLETEVRKRHANADQSTDAKKQETEAAIQKEMHDTLAASFEENKQACQRTLDTVTRDSINLLERSKKANIDTLTGVLKPKAFTEMVRYNLEVYRRYERENEVVVYAYVDLNNFKSLNDRYGQEGGDAILRAVGEALQKAPFRKTDIAGRIGGDEFAVCFTHVQPDKIDTVAEHLVSLLKDIELELAPAGKTEKEKVRPTVSIGLRDSVGEQIEDPEQFADTMRREAEMAGKRAKIRHGRKTGYVQFRESAPAKKELADFEAQALHEMNREIKMAEAKDPEAAKKLRGLAHEIAAIRYQLATSETHET